LNIYTSAFTEPSRRGLLKFALSLQVDAAPERNRDSDVYNNDGRSPRQNSVSDFTGDKNNPCLRLTLF
jgi:hypothetical protein